MRAPHVPPAEPGRGPSPGPLSQRGGRGTGWGLREVLAGRDVERWLWEEGSVCWGGRGALRPLCGGLGRGRSSGVILGDGRADS